MDFLYNAPRLLAAYFAANEAGLVNVRLANLGVFVKTEKDHETLFLRAREAI